MKNRNYFYPNIDCERTTATHNDLSIISSQTHIKQLSVANWIRRLVVVATLFILLCSAIVCLAFAIKSTREQTSHALRRYRMELCYVNNTRNEYQIKMECQMCNRKHLLTITTSTTPHSIYIGRLYRKYDHSTHADIFWWMANAEHTPYAHIVMIFEWIIGIA